MIWEIIRMGYEIVSKGMNAVHEKSRACVEDPKRNRQKQKVCCPWRTLGDPRTFGNVTESAYIAVIRPYCVDRYRRSSTIMVALYAPQQRWGEEGGRERTAVAA